MKPQTIARLFLFALLLLQANSVFAFETDQYNLPPEPLADVGGEVSEYVEQNLTKAIDKINAEISARQNCLEKTASKSGKVKCNSAEKERERLSFLRSEDAVAQEIYNLLGAGTIPFTKSGSWMESHRFLAQPARYKTSFRQSIFYIVPTNYLTISSTVNLYGAQFGTDKIAHFFQQGYSYYKIYRRAFADGATPEKASEKAVRWGRASERTFYGTLVSGVYSNADLCANFVGMKFYLNLTRDIKIGDNTKPAVLVLENGIWKFNENSDIRQNVIKPFISNHLNEALNPSIFIVGLRSFVRRTVRKQSCRQWLNRFPNQTQSDFENASRALQLWNGEDYGFTDSDKFITIANTCFGDKSAK
ncbi:MAG: hypothetical protein M3033_09200 [Acidobacteriota bacterium]|nr:hypothetical protein [Acidobacteriota bacterium]